ncbi:MAG: DUF4252 domain-containing protein [Flavobacteriales bacterium]|nr:DUF4252 domain-containing protein [Flavobacteriales bacterium]
MRNRERYIALMVLLFMGTAMLAQNNSIDRHFNKYKDDDRFTRISVSGKMFSLFANFEMDDPAEQEVVETMSKITGLKMLIGDSIDEARSIYSTALSKTSKDMEELMTVENSENEMRFMISESGGMISELLMIMYDNNSVILMSLIGDIDLKQISKMSQKMNIEGFEHLENVGE